jgi:hypothetical protein
MRCPQIILVATLLAIPMSSWADSRVSVNERLVEYYSKPVNYRRVRRDVLSWHKTTRNGCVAFVSTALRHIGYAVPLDGKRSGFGVSRITFAFSAYLRELGWKRITSTVELLPGDIVFTTGYPDHVFVFHSWSHQRRGLARVIDNQGHLKKRSLNPSAGSDTAAFSYALRLPWRG